MLLGAGGVDDGEDAEVIVHEYGHAIQDAQVPGYGATAEGGAMGEAFGDFLAAAYYAPRSRRLRRHLRHGVGRDELQQRPPQPCLRRIDSAKRYPKDIVGAVHTDGELWSAYLWRIREQLGTTPPGALGQQPAPRALDRTSC